MEMVIGSIVAMFLGMKAGRAMRLSDVQTIVVICCSGVGCCITGLAYLWLADVTVGQSASPMFAVTGFIGAILGIVTYMIYRYIDWFIDVLKHNGLL